MHLEVMFLKLNSNSPADGLPGNKIGSSILSEADLKLAKTKEKITQSNDY